MRRRQLLLGSALAATTAATPAVTGAARAQVLIVGAGWAGLAAAYALRAERDLDVHLVDRTPVWRALPLSNPWLVGLTGERLPRIDLAGWAQRHGVRFSAGTVTAIDRTARRVDFVRSEASASAPANASRPPAARIEPLPYDALLLAAGAVADHAAWFGNDARAAGEARTRFPAGFAADELDLLKQHLHAFAGGTLVMTVPPPPLRCPPAPYERALLVAAWLRRRGLRARLVLLDATGGMPRFNRLLATASGGSLAVEHHRHQRIAQVDPFARRIVTADGTIDFEHAMLLPPMRAPRLLADAALVEGGDGGSSSDNSGDRGNSGASRYAAVDPLTLRTVADKRIWVAGDALGRISPLFGAYPKTAQIAAETGAAAAAQITAALRSAAAPPPSLPTSACHVWLGSDPPEQLLIDVSHHLRADGIVTQQVRQTDNPVPRDEDLAWARAVLRQRLGVQA